MVPLRALTPSQRLLAGGLFSCSLLAGASAVTGSEPPQDPGAAVDWNARTAEHLLNRAAFGASPAEIEAAVEAGLEATVERLVRGPGGVSEDLPILRPGVPKPAVMTAGPDFEETPPLAIVDRFYLDKGQLGKITTCREFSSHWLESMVSGADPLRDRMTLFWHGHFVSSYKEVTEGLDMVRQMSFLRAHALGDLESLVRGIARDPAMLEYLNNDINVKSAPNENWARELMELFLLGEGHYSEDDIKEAARAFTGWTRRDHAFVFRRDLHDYGPKTVLGVTGNLDGDAVIDILLAEPRCAEFLAEKLLAYFEGLTPPPERTQHYAALLRDGGYNFDGFLRRLFSDPGFYRDEVLGTRIAAPVEYYVSTTRRLGLRPPMDLLFVTATLSGQELFAPPNVKGWEEGPAWLTTGSVMGRSNGLGILLGEYDRDLKPFAAAAEENKRRGFQGAYRDYLSMIGWLGRSAWDPRLPLAEDLGLAPDAPDAEVVSALLEHLLAVAVPVGRADDLVRVTAALRSELDASAPLLADESNELLEQLVHVMLSLPEAQML